MGSKPPPSIVVFAKWPRPGDVKTRLTPALTPFQACRVHELMLNTVLDIVCALPAKRRFLAVSPDSARQPAAERWPTLDAVVPQGPGDLGRRIVRVSEGHFQRHAAGPLLILGTDSPDLPRRAYRHAAAALADRSAVICPSHDGGYCLIGVPEPLPALFAGIDWGSPRVAEQTRAAACANGVPLVELDAWEDVDTLDDIERLVQRLATATEGPLQHLRRGLLSAKLPGIRSEQVDE